MFLIRNSYILQSYDTYFARSFIICCYQSVHLCHASLKYLVVNLSFSRENAQQDDKLPISDFVSPCMQEICVIYTLEPRPHSWWWWWWWWV